MLRFLLMPLFMALLLAAILVASARGQDLTLPNVTVSGEASTSVQPDLAEIRAGVTNQAKTAREAAEVNARMMTAVLSAAKEAGVEPKNIQTARISVQPLFSRPQQDGRNEPPRISGYQASNNVTLRLRDIAKIGDALDRLIAAGANTVHGVDFQVSESSKLLDTVRAAAVADARRRSMRRQPARSLAAWSRSTKPASACRASTSCAPRRRRRRRLQPARKRSACR